MLRATFLSFGFLISTPLMTCAEEIKCGSPSVITQLEDHFLNVAATRIRTEAIPEDKRDLARQMRFPDGDPKVTISDFLGASVDESTKKCTAKVTLSAGQRKSAEIELTYYVSLTEDGKTLIKGDFVPPDAYLITFYDIANGL